MYSNAPEGYLRYRNSYIHHDPAVMLEDKACHHSNEVWGRGTPQAGLSRFTYFT